MSIIKKPFTMAMISSKKKIVLCSGVTKNTNLKGHYSIEDALSQSLKMNKSVHKIEIFPSSR